MRTGSSQFSSYMTDHLFLSQSQRKVQTMLSSMISPVKTEVQRITEYLSTQNPLPQYLPYARFLLSADLTHTAKLLYTLLLDRATLSQKNNWVDAKGRVYVLYPIIHLAKDLRCSTSSVTRALTELENADLLERLHTGFSKPSQILLKIPVGMQKCTSNQRNKNNLNDNHLIRANNTRLSFGEYQNIFLTEKEYKRLKVDFAGLDTLIEQLSAYIQSTGKKYADHAATLRIWTKRQQSEKKTAPGIPDYTFAKGESL